MTDAIAIILAVALGLAVIAIIVLGAVVKAQHGELGNARTSELNAYKAQVAAERATTAAEAKAATSSDVARKALAALKVYEEQPSTPETDRATNADPDRPVADRAADLERLLNL